MFVAMQIKATQMYSDNDHVTMVLPDVGRETRSYLEGLGSMIVEVPPIVPDESRSLILPGGQMFWQYFTSGTLSATSK